MIVKWKCPVADCLADKFFKKSFNSELWIGLPYFPYFIQGKKWFTPGQEFLSLDSPSLHFIWKTQIPSTCKGGFKNPNHKKKIKTSQVLSIEDFTLRPGNDVHPSLLGMKFVYLTWMETTWNFFLLQCFFIWFLSVSWTLNFYALYSQILW